MNLQIERLELPQLPGDNTTQLYVLLHGLVSIVETPTALFLYLIDMEDQDRVVMQEDLALLNRLSTPDDRLAEYVDLFPLFGVTQGNCGLLIAAPTSTILVAGDAVATLDHFLAGQVLPDASDISTAQESLREVYEIADLIVPGHDNIFMNPRTRGM